jgi:hypothetical protein
VLLLTAKTEKPDLVAGLQAGADDFLTKPFDADELQARLRAGRRILQLQENLIAAQDHLRFQATHDPLTGIWNRAGILDFLHRELSRISRIPHALSVMMADIDHFKEINDTYGHEIGDVVLCDVAKRLEGAETANAMGCSNQPGAEMLQAGGGCAIFAGADSPLTQAVGLGLDGPVRESEIWAIEDFLRRRGARVAIDFCPLADPGLLEVLSRRGYRATQFNNVLVKRLAGTEIVLTPRVRRALTS